MKICIFEHPRLPSAERFNDIANTPLWSCLMGGYAAASLEQAGFDTRFIDAALPGRTFEKSLEEIQDIDPDLLCINAVYFWEKTPVFFNWLSDLKAEGFSGHINLFGFFPTLVYHEILQTAPAVDSICIGEFEQTLTELASALNRSKPLDAIPGLALASGPGSEPVIHRPPVKDLDAIAFPVRPSIEGTAAVLASRGCYNHCSFCPVPSFYNKGPLWRGRSPENIYQEMAELAERGVKDFYFVDPNFIGPGRAGKKRVIRLMEMIRGLNIRFGMETRPEDLDDEVLENLVASGFKTLLMGVESGSDRILGAIDKRSGAEKAGHAISLCRKYGIEPEIGFLMFVPDSRISDLKQNIDFLMKNRLLDRLDRTANLLCHCQIVLKGTTGFRHFEAQDRLTKKGFLGFEAEIEFADPKVKWMSQLIVHACHTVLRSMSEKSSAVYWKNDHALIHLQVNDYLVDLFYSLLEKSERKEDCAAISRDAVEDEKNGIFEEIRGMVD